MSPVTAHLAIPDTLEEHRRYGHKPINVKLGVQTRLLTVQQARDLAWTLLRCIEAAPRIEPPPLKLDGYYTLNDCRIHPGRQLLVAVEKSNNAAYKSRKDIEARGYRAKTRRLRAGEYGVYAWIEESV